MKLKSRNLGQVLIGPALFFSLGTPAHAATGQAAAGMYWFCVLVALSSVIVWLAMALHRSQRSLRLADQERLRLRLLADTATQYLLLLDEDFSVLEANKSAAKALGTGWTALRQAHLSEIDPGATPERLEQDRLALAAGQDVEHRTRLRQHGTATLTPSLQNLRSLRVQEQSVILCRNEDQCALFELRERLHQVENSLRSSREDAEAASRMKSEFIANMNHEIRTPMNAIIGYTEMLASSDLGEREKRFVDTIYRSGITLVSILNDIMDLSKLEAGRMKLVHAPARLTSIIEDVSTLFSGQIKAKQLLYRCTVAETVPAVLLMDGARVKQVLQNLVSNAVKFTEQGSITVSADAVRDQGEQEAYTLVLRVSDTGIGIDEQELVSIFEFFQHYENKAPPQSGGLGLGLTLCGRLVSIMGGRMDLESTLGKGSSFTVILPGIRSVEEILPEQVEVVLDSNLNRNKLLVVDDMELIIDVFRDYFRTAPVEILSARNGEEAIGLARREKPGVIFMDLNLVGMNGRETTMRLKNSPETAKIPVVVMTGHILEEEDYQPLFDGILQKPFHLDLLKEVVGQYIDLSPTPRKAAATPAEPSESQPGSVQDWISACWTPSLDHLLARANSSGSLSAALSLGEALVKEGGACKEQQMVEVGRKLVQYARDPDIMGVDKLLALLTQNT